ncbi:MAG: hypothetical protein ACP5JN_01295 [Candidatus Micrarchaeia archaeon]
MFSFALLGDVTIANVAESIKRIDSKKWKEELGYLISAMPELEKVKKFVLNKIQ